MNIEEAKEVCERNGFRVIESDSIAQLTSVIEIPRYLYPLNHESVDFVRNQIIADVARLLISDMVISFETQEHEPTISHRVTGSLEVVLP